MKKVIAVLLCLMMLTLCACENEKKMEISETPLRALTETTGFAYDCSMPYKEEIYKTPDIDLRLYNKYTREDAEPVRTLQLLDRKWQLYYETSRSIGLGDMDVDVYETEGPSKMEVWYLAESEQVESVWFSSDDQVDLWRPADFTPDEAGFLAYAYSICAYYGIDVTDYIVECVDEGKWWRVNLKRYLMSAESVYEVSFCFSEDGYLDWFRLPPSDWGTVVMKEQELALFTDENIINAVKHRISPFLEDGVQLLETQINAKTFFLKDGKLYMWVIMDFSYKKSGHYFDRIKHPSHYSFPSNFVIEIA